MKKLTLGYKIVTLFFLRVESSVVYGRERVREREREREREKRETTEGLGHLEIFYVDPYLLFLSRCPNVGLSFDSMLEDDRDRETTDGLGHMNIFNDPYLLRRYCSYRGAQPLAGALRDWPHFFWSQDWDWPLLFGYLRIYNLIMLTNFRHTYTPLPSVYTCVLQLFCLHRWNT